MPQFSRSLAIGGASIVALVAGCSQPASYAEIDLSGSYGSSELAYSPVTGAPVYTATSTYGGQSFPAEYVPQAQLAYSDAPTNQVASLGYGGGFDSYGALQSRPIIDAPAYRPLAQSTPLIQEGPISTSPLFAEEVAAAEVLEAPVPVPQPIAVEPLPAPAEEIETAYAVPFYDEPVETAPAAPTPAPRAVIETEALPELEAEAPAPERPPFRSTDADSVLDDYVSVGGTRVEAPSAVPAPRNPLAENTYVEVPETPAPRDAAPQRRTEGEGSDSAYTRAARDLLPPRAEEARLPVPSQVPAPPVERAAQAPEAEAAPLPSLGGGVRIPDASTGYPRPYEVLRPGIWPELDTGAQGMVEAPASVPAPVIARAPVPAFPAGTAPIQPASVPVRAEGFAWPVQGEVYRHGSGALEIEPASAGSVAASGDGQVIHVEDGPRGHLVVIEHRGGVRSLTLGLAQVQVRVGQRVAKGQTLGTMDRRGRLHFELHDAERASLDALSALKG